MAPSMTSFLSLRRLEHTNWTRLGDDVRRSNDDFLIRSAWCGLGDSRDPSTLGVSTGSPLNGSKDVPRSEWKVREGELPISIASPHARVLPHLRVPSARLRVRDERLDGRAGWNREHLRPSTRDYIAPNLAQECLTCDFSPTPLHRPCIGIGRGRSGLLGRINTRASEEENSENQWCQGVPRHYVNDSHPKSLRYTEFRAFYRVERRIERGQFSSEDAGPR